jgi:hypothetical protein
VNLPSVDHQLLLAFVVTSFPANLSLDDFWREFEIITGFSECKGDWRRVGVSGSVAMRNSWLS